MNIINDIAIQTRIAIPLFAVFSFIILIFGIYKAKPILIDFFKTIKKKDWIILLIIFISGIIIRFFFIPFSHMVFSDENYYILTAKTILTNFGMGQYAKSIGWPFLLSIIFSIFGVSSNVAISATSIISAATIFPLFFLIYIITKKKNLSLIFLVIYTFHPLVLKWSNTAETNTASQFFIITAMFFFILHFKKKEFNTLLLCAAAITFTAMIRLENHYLLPLFIIGIILFEKEFFSKYSIKQIVIIVLVLAITIPNLFGSLAFQTSTNWVESDTRGRLTGSNWSLQNFAKNSIKYGTYVFSDKLASPIFLGLCTLGLVFHTKKDRKLIILMATWFAINWIGYFTSYFQTLAGNDRFYICFLPSIFILASLTIKTVYNTLQRLEIRNANYKIAKIGITFIIILGFIHSGLIIANYKYYIQPSNSTILETWSPEILTKIIPHECTIVNYEPVILKSTSDLNTIDFNSFKAIMQQNKQSKLLENECVLFFEDIFCEIDIFEKECNFMHTEYNLEKYKSISLGKDKFEIYKIVNKKQLE